MSNNVLAILGGNPRFLELLHVGRPYIGDKSVFLSRLDDILERKWLTNQGKYCAQLEARLVDLLQVKHCVAVCNGTIGLQLAIRSADVSGEAIIPSFTFAATAHALEWQSVTPVFADVDPVTHCLSPESVEAAITPRTTAIIGVHLWGQPCNVDELAKIATRNHLKLLFDAAHGIGCKHDGTFIANFGDAEVFSFHATKIINSFEGGCVTTNDDELVRKLRLMRNFGFLDYDTVVDVGTNAKMSEPCAAMCLTNLESFERFVDHNRNNRSLYRSGLSTLTGIRLWEPSDTTVSNHQYVVVEIDERTCPLNRDQILAVLWAEGIIARRYWYPGCHNMEPYKTKLGSNVPTLPVTEQLCREVLVLPTGPDITTEQITAVCDVITAAVDQAETVRQVATLDLLRISNEERRKRTGSA